MNSSGKAIPSSDAVKITLGKIKGSYALGILYEGDETCFIGARNEAPLVIGLGEGEYFIASDIPPILPYTRNFIFMEDGEVAVLSSKGVKVYDAKGEEIRKRTEDGLNWNPLMAEKGGYKHFMLKEIFEQPRAVTDTIRGRLSEEKGDVILDNVRLDRGDPEEDPSDRSDCLWHILSCSPGRKVPDRRVLPNPCGSRYRLGVSVPESHHRRE